MSLWRNLEGTVGLPRGANDGLEFVEDDSFCFSSGDHVSSSLSPSPNDYPSVSLLGWHVEGGHTLKVASERRVFKDDGVHVEWCYRTKIMVIIQANVTKRVGEEAGKNVGVDVGQFHQRHQGGQVFLDQ